MANYVVSGKQMFLTVVSMAALLTVSAFTAISYYEYRELPEVTVEGDKCVKVVNFRNGDAYQCQDKDVVLRHYRLIK